MTVEPTAKQNTAGEGSTVNPPATATPPPAAPAAATPPATPAAPPAVDLTQVNARLDGLQSDNKKLQEQIDFYKKDSEKNKAKYKQIRDTFSEIAGEEIKDDEKFDPRAAIATVSDQHKQLNDRLNQSEVEKHQFRAVIELQKIAAEKKIPAGNMNLLSNLFQSKIGAPDPAKGYEVDFAKAVDEIVEANPILSFDHAAHVKGDDPTKKKDEEKPAIDMLRKPTSQGEPQTQQPTTQAPPPIGSGDGNASQNYDPQSWNDVHAAAAKDLAKL